MLEPTPLSAPRTLCVDNPADASQTMFAPAKASAKRAAEDATTTYACLMAGTAAHLLRLAFGAHAHRAVFSNTHAIANETVANLIAVYDATGMMLWYNENDAFLFGSCAVYDRDLAEAYGGPANPILDEGTRQAIEDAASIANAWAVDGSWFVSTDLRILEDGPDGDGHYPEDLFELIIVDELANGEDLANTSTTIRYVSIEGIRSEGLWRDLETALGLPTYGLGRFKEWAADQPKYLGPEYNLVEAIEWARQWSLPHTIETHISHFTN